MNDEDMRYISSFVSFLFSLFYRIVFDVLFYVIYNIVSVENIKTFFSKIKTKLSHSNCLETLIPGSDIHISKKGKTGSCLNNYKHIDCY